MFARIFLAAPDNDELWDWVGWVKSRFRSLLLKVSAGPLLLLLKHLDVMLEAKFGENVEANWSDDLLFEFNHAAARGDAAIL